MNKLEDLFNNNKVFIPYITAGDPNMDTTRKLIFALEKAGADIIELGVPFSDPIADGPVIQKAHIRGLQSGTTLKKIIDLVKDVRKTSSIPLLFMMSYNAVVQYGGAKFVKDIKKAGLNGLIVPDLPFESATTLDKELKKVDLPLINMIAPTTSDKRIKSITKNSRGFIYLISTTGITGMRKSINTSTADLIKKIKKVKNVPVCVGFGISTPEMAKKTVKNSDGVIVGSAIVNIIEEYKVNATGKVQHFAGTIKEAIR